MRCRLFLLGVDAVEGVQELDLEDGWVIAGHGDGVGIRNRKLSSLLIRVIQHDALERAVLAERDERRPSLGIAIFGDEKVVPSSVGLTAPRSRMPACDGTDFQIPSRVTPAGIFKWPAK